ncbi:uncharacterized protein LOC134530116 [Bacillus rossius redtenbacheri]|uniref:uncharacterized protein LOC134530116 n=1 Tax=Bacillus rossius redtenbacheri TaxID=93214 RepID=UPI002FDD8F7D
MTPLLATSLALLLVSPGLARPPHHRGHRHRDSGDGVLYDQRQNGTDNLRLHVDGVVIIHAPVESLTALAAAADTGDLEQQLAELLGSLGEESSTTTEAAVQGPAEASEDPADKPMKDTEVAASKPHKDKDDAAGKPMKDTEVPVSKPKKDKDDPAENPKKDTEVAASKPQKDKADANEKPSKKDRPRIRLSSLLIPLLRRL